MADIARLKRRKLERKIEQGKRELQERKENLAMGRLFDSIFEGDTNNPQYKTTIRERWLEAETVFGHALPEKLYVNKTNEKFPVTYIILKQDYFEDLNNES